MDKLSYEEVIEELVIEADALEKDLEEAYVMIDALDKDIEEACEVIDALETEAANWKRTAKALHKAYLEQVDINKAKQDELDFQSEQLEEFMLGSESEEKFFVNVGLAIEDLHEFLERFGEARGGEIVAVSLDDLVDTEDELYDPFMADRYS